MAYGKVQETFWDDPVVRELAKKNEDTRTLFLFFMTCRHRNRLGCYVLDPRYAAADLGWLADRVEVAMQMLEEAGRIAYDHTNRVVFVRHYLRHNTLENQKVVTGAISDLASVPATPLLPALLAAVEENQRAHYGPVLTALRNRITNRMGNGKPNPDETVGDTVAPPIRSLTGTEPNNPVAAPPERPLSAERANGGPPPAEPAVPDAAVLNRLRGEAISMVRATWPDGKAPREWRGWSKPPRPWTDAREGSIWNDLVKWDPPEDVNAAARMAIRENRNRPWSFAFFHADRPGAQEFFRQMLAKATEAALDELIPVDFGARPL